MNLELICKTSLVAYYVAILGWALLGVIYIHSSEIYLLLCFSINTIWGGAYVYRNSSERKIAQAVITILSVPLLFYLFMIFGALVSPHPGSGSEAGFAISD